MWVQFQILTLEIHCTLYKEHLSSCGFYQIFAFSFNHYYYNFNSLSSGKCEKYQSTFCGVTFSNVAGFHFGLWSLSTRTEKNNIVSMILKSLLLIILCPVSIHVGYDILITWMLTFIKHFYKTSRCKVSSCE